jgi:hypothetical protein
VLLPKRQPTAQKRVGVMKSPENAPKAKRRWGMTDLSPDATHDISSALTTLLADVFALYLKTKNFHWHLSGPHFHGPGWPPGSRSVVGWPIAKWPR